MKFGFEARAEVTASSSSVAWHRVLTAALCLSVFVVITEFFLNRRVLWIFIPPMLYIFYAWRRSGMKTCIQDVRGYAAEKEKDIEITLFDVIRDKRDIYSRRLAISYKDCFFYWNEQTNELGIRCNGSVALVDNQGKIIQSKNITQGWVYVYPQKSYETKFRELFAFAREIDYQTKGE